VVVDLAGRVLGSHSEYDQPVTIADPEPVADPNAFGLCLTDRFDLPGIVQ
jgi:hypothetical protein